MLVRADTLERVERVVLQHAPDTWPGWCRGVEALGDHWLVGLTTLRGSRHRELVGRWLRGRKLPTRVAEVSRDGQLVREVEVGQVADGTLYAIHAR